MDVNFRNAANPTLKMMRDKPFRTRREKVYQNTHTRGMRMLEPDSDYAVITASHAQW